MLIPKYPLIVLPPSSSLSLCAALFATLPSCDCLPIGYRSLAVLPNRQSQMSDQLRGNSVPSCRRLCLSFYVIYIVMFANSLCCVCLLPLCAYFRNFTFTANRFLLFPSTVTGVEPEKKRKRGRERGEKCANFAGCANYEVTVMTVSQPARDFN